MLKNNLQRCLINDHCFKRPAVGLLVLCFLVFPAQAELLVAVDLGQIGQDVEPGYTEFSETSFPIPSIDPQAFAGGTWDIESVGLTIVVRNYGDIDTTPLGNLLEDSYLTNSSGDDKYFELIFDGLAPGNYSLTTYHHSFANGGASAEILGGLTGTTLTSLGSVEGTTGDDITDFASFSTDFVTTALFDGYSLRFEPINAAGSFHFDLSGFTLSGTPVPLPPALALFGSSLAWLFASMRRKRRNIK